MGIRVVQLGSSRNADEGIRIGTVRRPPRGVRKYDYARLDFYDVWLPQLAPSVEAVKLAKQELESPATWKVFEKQYTRELMAGGNLRLIDLLATLSKRTNFSVGCYCIEENRCHRSILKRILKERGAVIQ